MGLRTRFLVYILLIHIIFILLTVILFTQSKSLFILSEALIAMSLYMSFRLYRKIFRPYKLLASGVSSLRDKDFSVKFKKIGQSDLDELIEVYNKMIDTLRLERTKLNENYHFLDKLISASPSGIIIFNLNNQIEKINYSAEKIVFESYNEEIKYLPPEWNKLEELSPGESIVIKRNAIDQYKCHKSYFQDRGAKRQFVIIEELTEEVYKIEKHAYEKVIRMMAHEVNNTLGSVNSIINSSAFYLENQKLEANADFVHALKVASDRNEGLNMFMKNFADVVRLPKPMLRKSDLHHILNNIITLMQDRFRGEISVEKIYPNEEFILEIDPEQMEQVIFNIIKNATEAIESSGKIEIETLIKPQRLIIRNNGTPIDDSIKHKLFEPFYSTKTTGQGIGLTLIKEILVNHGFRFDLYTKSDGWTEFKIILG